MNLRFLSKVLIMVSCVLLVSLPNAAWSQTASQIQMLANPANAERAATAYAVRVVATARAKANAAVRDATGNLIDINTVSRARLMTLPGVGQMVSQKIILGRPYNTKTEVARVIGNTTYTKIQALITVGKAVVAQPARSAATTHAANSAPTPTPAKTIRPNPIK